MWGGGAGADPGFILGTEPISPSSESRIKLEERSGEKNGNLNALKCDFHNFRVIISTSIEKI